MIKHLLFILILGTAIGLMIADIHQQNQIFLNGGKINTQAQIEFKK